ncbi:hypothetical protein ACFL5Z_07005 [Planctomycetota bacterium]
MTTIETQIHNTECQTGLHTDHLCYMISQGFHISDEQEFKALVDKPEFKCNHCGRTAKSSTNICVPAQL